MLFTFYLLVLQNNTMKSIKITEINKPLETVLSLADSSVDQLLAEV
jgi:hypothetical protein